MIDLYISSVSVDGIRATGMVPGQVIHLHLLGEDFIVERIGDRSTCVKERTDLRPPTPNA